MSCHIHLSRQLDVTLVRLDLELVEIVPEDHSVQQADISCSHAGALVQEGEQEGAAHEGQLSAAHRTRDDHEVRLAEQQQLVDRRCS